MGKEIILIGNKLDGMLSELRQEFSGLKDSLNVLTEEEAKLSAIWQGAAKETWEQNFLHKMMQVENSLHNSTQTIAVLKEQALKLKKEEQEVVSLIETLPG